MRRSFPIACTSACAVLLTALASTPALAVVQHQVFTPYRFAHFARNDGSLSSTLDCTLGLCTVFNEFRFDHFSSDNVAIVKLRWTDADGYTLLSGALPWILDFGEPDVSVGRTTHVQYFGFHVPNIVVHQVVGTADFRGSIRTFTQCNGTNICDQEYLELGNLVPNPIPNFPSAGRQAAALAEPLGIRWALGRLSQAAYNPAGDATTTDLYAFQSLVESVGEDYRYTYELTNNAPTAFDFDFAQLGWSGHVDGESTVSWSFVSALAPSAVKGELAASIDGDELFGAGFHVLTPVPEPATWALWGLGLLAGAARARRRST